MIFQQKYMNRWYLCRRKKAILPITKNLNHEVFFYFSNDISCNFLQE